jgi:alanine racemase
MSRAWVDIDLAAVAANAKTLQELAPGAELCAVVKAGGYGHGAIEVARAALSVGATRVAVAQVGEGLDLRAAGLDVPIWVLAEPDPAELAAAAGAGLEPAVYSASTVAAAAAVGGLTVHLKVDTGMHRVGAAPTDVVALARQIAGSGRLRLGSVWTHLATADAPHDEPAKDGAATSFADRQLDRYERALADLAEAGIDVPLRHAANSAATIAHPRSHHDVVRCGIALYGLPPSPNLAGRADLCPALTWRSTVAYVKRLEAGEAVSYGQHQALRRDATVATIPVGYADGYRRALWNTGGAALIGGKRRPIVGVVTMDQLVVDCGDDRVEPGDDVVLIGKQGAASITADDLASSLQTINYEIPTSIGSRVERRYHGG